MKTRWLAPFITLILLCGVAELAVTLGWIESYLLPAPTQMAFTFWESRQELSTATLQTMWHAATASALALLLGVALGIALHLSRWLKSALLPYAIFFQTIPVIAIAPLLVIWLGFGSAPVIASGVLVCVFPLIMGTLEGLRAVDQSHHDLFKTCGASRLQTLTKLELPTALPYVFAALQVSIGLAIVGCIVSEFISGVGLGSVIDVARVQYRVDKMFCAIVLASALGAAALFVLKAARWLVLQPYNSRMPKTSR